MPVPCAVAGVPPVDSSREPCGDPAGHSMKPTCQRVGDPNCVYPADEHKKRGLEGILNVIWVGERAAAHAQHHRAVPSHQGRERGFGRVRRADLGLSRRELSEQLRVG